MRIVYIYLKSFGGMGGIENYSKVFMKCLQDLSSEKKYDIKIISLYDRRNDEKYISSEYFYSYNGNRFKYILNVLRFTYSADIVFVGHLNLAILGILIGSINRKVKQGLLIYGIEAWNKLDAIKKYYVRKCHNIISISEFTLNKFIKVNDICPKVKNILPPCLSPYYKKYQNYIIDDISFKTRYPINDNYPVLIAVCRLSSQERYKGYDNVIRAVALLKKDYPRIKYLIVGGGDSDEIARVNSLIKEQSLQNNVILTGYVSDEDLHKLYMSTNLLALPSSGEGFGIVFIEALSHGLPVLAGNSDASVETLQQGSLGVLVDPFDVEDIAEKLVLIFNKMVNVNLLNPEYLINEVEKHYSYMVFKNKLERVLQSFE